MKNRLETHERRINKITAEQTDIKVVISKLDTIINQLSNQVVNQIEDHEVRIRGLESDKAKKWDKFAWLAVGAIVAVLVGFIAVELGLR